LDNVAYAVYEQNEIGLLYGPISVQNLSQYLIINWYLNYYYNMLCYYTFVDMKNQFYNQTRDNDNILFSCCFFEFNEKNIVCTKAQYIISTVNTYYR